MGISLIFLLIIGIITIFTFVIPIFIAVKKRKKGKRPKKVSYVMIGLLLFHWLFFLTGGYALFPTNIADAIFLPIWLVLCLAGAFAAIYEFKNNRVFSLPIVGLTTISFLFSIFINGILKM